MSEYIRLIAAIRAANDGFVGLVDAKDVKGTGKDGGVVPDDAISESSVTQHVDAIAADIKAEELATDITDTTLRLAPDGNNGVEFVAGTGGLVAHAHDGTYHTGTLPEGDVSFDNTTGHTHDGTDSTKVDYTDLESIPSEFTPAAHTQTASTITDFDTEVENNVEVAANVAARHAQSHTFDSADHTGSLSEAKISFHNTTGHNHDGTDSTKVVYTDLTSIPIEFTPSAHTQAASTITDFDTEVSNNTNVAANTTHRTSDGKDHSDVVLNNTHRTSDGKDHSDVVLNNTHRTSDGKDHSDVVLANSHRADATIHFTEASINLTATQVSVADAGGYYTGAEVEAVLDEIGQTRAINGYDLLDPDTLPDLSFDAGTRTFTASVQAAKPNFSFWVDSKKVTKTTSQTVVVPDVTGTYYVVFDNSGTLQSIPQSSVVAVHFYENAITGLVYWNATDGTAILGDERHGILMDARTHHYNHSTFGARYESGLDITGLTNGGTTYTTTTSGYFWDEDIRHTISLLSTSPFIYRLGATGEWTGTTPDNKVSHTAGGSYHVWNEWTGSTWQLTEGGSSTDYWVIFYIATPDLSGYNVKKIIGHNAYKSANAARNAIDGERSTLSTEGLPNPEYIFLFATIVKRTGETQEIDSDGNLYLDLRTERGGGTGSQSTTASVAGNVVTNTANFNTHLSATDTDVQAALDTLDDHVHVASQVTDFDTEVSNNTNVAANTTHRTSDGKDHSDVVLNNTHRGSDGKDHSDVVLNNTHRTSDGTNHANVVLNDTHRGSDGKDHSDVVLANTHRADATIHFTEASIDVVDLTSASGSDGQVLTKGAGTATSWEDAGGGGTSVHNDLTSIQGGSATERYHLDASGYADVPLNTSARHAQSHTYDSADHTGSLSEANVSFNSTSGHAHNGFDAKKVTYIDLAFIPSTFAPSAHTQAASTITDFDVEVANNTTVAANTSARHAQSHAFDSADHTGALSEAKISFNTSTGHNHDGTDSTKVAYTDLTSIPSTFAPSAHTQAASTITDFDAEVSSNTSVATNTTHRTSDGKNHSDVVLANSHRVDATIHFTEASIDVADLTSASGSDGQVLTKGVGTATSWEDAGGGGGGDVSSSGTPVNNQVAIWTDSSTIEGDTGLTWDGSTLAASAITCATLTASTSIKLGDNDSLIHGTGSDTAIKYSSSQLSLFIGVPDVGTSGSNKRALIICERGDLNTAYNHSAQTNPTLYIQSSDAAQVNDYISFAHDQTDGNITTGNGRLTLNPSTYTRIGNAASSSHSMGADDLFCSADAEVKGTLYLDGAFVGENEQHTSSTGPSVTLGTHILLSSSSSTVTVYLGDVDTKGYHLYVKNNSGSPNAIEFDGYSDIDGGSGAFSREYGSVHLYNVDGNGSWIVLSEK